MSIWEYANPKKFMQTSAWALPWSTGLAVLTMVGGLIWGFFLTPDDYRQGSTVKIIFIHVPSAMIAINAWAMMLVTSLPKVGYSAPAILAAYRLRWQIELAFKRLKSLLHIDRLPTRTERGSQSWLYAHLILALCDDLSQDILDSSS